MLSLMMMMMLMLIRLEVGYKMSLWLLLLDDREWGNVAGRFVSFLYIFYCMTVFFYVFTFFGWT